MGQPIKKRDQEDLAKYYENPVRIILRGKDADKVNREAILKGINHKLNYLRNPRNKADSVTRMLVKNKASFEEVTEEIIDEAEDGKSHATGSKSAHTVQTKSSKSTKKNSNSKNKL